jgi:tRNA G18 (ribose-2'-O)-methylase SpoU
MWKTRRAVEVGDPCLEPYRGLIDRASSSAEQVIVEGRIALERALGCGWRPRSIVATRSTLEALETVIPEGVEVLELDAASLRELVGFDFHRGCLAAFERPPATGHPSAELVAQLRSGGRSTIVVAHGLADPSNVGAIARTARALEAGLLVVDAHGADPYARRAIRASMGHVFCLPVVQSPDLPGTLAFVRRELGAHVVAATTGGDAQPLRMKRPADHVVVLLGNEGAGLPAALIAAADECVTIEMAPAVDSLNVATALGILLWAWR